MLLDLLWDVLTFVFRLGVRELDHSVPLSVSKQPHKPIADLRITDGWELVARDLGLALRYEDGRPLLTGELNGRPLRVEVSAFSGRHDTRVRLGGLPQVLDVSSRTDGGQGKASGDPSFDVRVAVHGPDETLVPLFDADTRHIVRVLLTAQPGAVLPRVRQGWLTAHAPVPLDAESLRALIQRCDRLATALTPEEDPVARLERTVREDPVPAVRIRALELMLAQGFASDDLIDEARGADSSALRLVVARHERNAETLAGLAQDAGITSRVRMLAVQALADLGELPRLADLAAALCRRNPTRGQPEEEAVARQIAECLRQRATPADVWPPYLAAGWPTLTVLALDELALHGERRHLAAVMPLRDSSPPTGPAARRALLAIRQRLGDDEIGTLSIAPHQGEVGTVSFTREGRLSESES